MVIKDKFNDWKTIFKSERRINKKIIRAFLKSIPKSNLIPILLELKIIERAWEKKGNKYHSYGYEKELQELKELTK